MFYLQAVVTLLLVLNLLVIPALGMFLLGYAPIKRMFKKSKAVRLCKDHGKGYRGVYLLTENCDVCRGVRSGY